MELTSAWSYSEFVWSGHTTSLSIYSLEWLNKPEAWICCIQNAGTSQQRHGCRPSRKMTTELISSVTAALEQKELNLCQDVVLEQLDAFCKSFASPASCKVAPELADPKFLGALKSSFLLFESIASRHCDRRVIDFLIRLLRCIWYTTRRRETLSLLSDLIPSLSSLLTSNIPLMDMALTSALCRVVANLALTDTNEEQFVAAGVIPALVAFLRSSAIIVDGAAIEGVLLACGNLSSTAAHRAALLQADEGSIAASFAAFLERPSLTSSPSQLKQLLRLGRNLALSEGARVALVEAGVIGALVPLLVAPIVLADETLTLWATALALQLADRAAHRLRLARAGCAEVLCTLLRSDHLNDEAAPMACSLLAGVAATHATPRLEFLRGNGLGALANLIEKCTRTERAKPSDLEKRCGVALEMLARSPECLDAIKAIPSLWVLLAPLLKNLE